MLLELFGICALKSIIKDTEKFFEETDALFCELDILQNELYENNK